MKLHDLKPNPGAKKSRIRAGRGTAGRRGKTAGRGTKGQGARAGGGDGLKPGQVLVSDVVRQLLLGKGFEFTPMGEAELKGLDEAVAVFEVTW